MFSKLKTTIGVIRLWNTLKKNGGIRICSEAQVQDLAAFIGYRAQLALYELHTDLKEDMDWEDFISFVQWDTAVRKKIQRIVTYAILHFDTERLDFELPIDALEYREDHPDDPLIGASQIFSDKMGRGMVKFLLIQFETEHFKRLAAVAPHYTWKIYMHDLTNDQELWNKFSRGLQHGLRQLDFKASWTANATQDELLHLEFQEADT